MTFHTSFGHLWYNKICYRIRYLTSIIRYLIIKSVVSKNKITITTTHFQKKLCIKIVPTQNTFKWIFVYYKCHISIDLTFLKKLMLVRQANQKSVIFVTIGAFLNKGFKFQPNAFNRCHDWLMKPMNLSDIAIFNIKSAGYPCIVSGISKNKAINL